MLKRQNLGRLHNNCPAANLITRNDIADLNLNQIAAAQLVVDRKIEQRLVPETPFAIKIKADRPNLLLRQWPLAPRRFCLRSKLRGSASWGQIESIPWPISSVVIGQVINAGSGSFWDDRAPSASSRQHAVPSATDPIAALANNYINAGLEPFGQKELLGGTFRSECL